MPERQTIDARCAFCPGPLLELIAALGLAAVGDEIDIWSSDRGSATEIPAWCAKVGHAVVETREREGYWSIVIRKAK